MAERISSAEHEIMEVLWRDSPLTATEVADRVPQGREWSIRTVKTLLARLLAKGALAHEEDGRRYLYRPAVAREDYVAEESGRMIDRLFGGRVTPLVAQLAERSALGTPSILGLLLCAERPSEAETAFREFGVLRDPTDREVPPTARRHLPDDKPANPLLTVAGDDPRAATSVPPPGF